MKARAAWLLASLVACSGGEALIDAGEDVVNDATSKPDVGQDSTVNDAGADATVDDATTNDASDATTDDASDADAFVDVSPCNPDATSVVDAETMTLLAAQQVGAAIVALDDTTAYWGEVNGPVMSCPIAGCDAGPTTLFASDGGATSGAIAVHGPTLYWGKLASIMTCTLPGCTNPTPFVTGQMAAHIVVDANNVYWTDNVYGAVRQCAIGGCNNNPITLASSQQQPFGLAVDGANVYWTNLGVNLSDGGISSQVMKCAIGGCGGNPTTLVSGLQPTYNMATDGNDVYFVTMGTIQKCAVGGCGGVPTPVVTSGAVTLAIDGPDLYWTNGATEEIRKCPLSDCCGGVTVLAANQPAVVYGLAVNDASVCWSTYSTTDGGNVAVATPK